MAEKQGIPDDTAPPPYPEGQYNPSYGVNPPMQGYQSQPGYPPQGQPGYPPVQAPPGYPQQAPPGYPQQGPPGYPQQGPQQGQPGYQPQDKAGYPAQGQPGFGYPAGYTQQPMPAGHMATTNVTVVQTGGPAMVIGVYPPDHCGLAWFACLFCCWPIGICAILNSNNARDAINRGDLASAATYSQMAKKYATWAIACGTVIIILSIVLRVILYSSATQYN